MHNISAVGIDLIEISRIRKIVERNPGVLEKLLTENELHAARLVSRTPGKYIYISRIFAMKESVLKACGTGWQEGVSWHDVEISGDLKYSQQIKISGKLKIISDSRSIAGVFAVSGFCGHYAVAQAIAVKIY